MKAAAAADSISSAKCISVTERKDAEITGYFPSSKRLSAAVTCQQVLAMRPRCGLAGCSA
eukprot:1527783-Pleurochrysis_carterae.AAC.2